MTFKLAAVIIAVVCLWIAITIFAGPVIPTAMLMAACIQMHYEQAGEELRHAR